MDPLRPGDRGQVGPYRLLGRLGGGGMGEVFLGSSPGGRRVVVKLIRPDFANDPGFRRRFAREVEAARRVGGFHTAQVVDAAPEADPPWMVTAYIAGPSLQELITRDGPLPVESVGTLGAGLAEGLAAIHDCGLVHRDLKPANVIMADDGPRIIDFGIVHAADATVLTEDGAVVGTYAFMSPEQLRGDGIEPASDVFSLGGVLAFAATGHGPFHATTIPAVIHRILATEPDLGRITGHLRELIVACLAKTAADRPGTADLLSRFTGHDAAPASVSATIADAAPTGTSNKNPVDPPPDPHRQQRREITSAPRHAATGANTPSQQAPGIQADRLIKRRAVLAGGLATAATAGITTAWLSWKTGQRNGATATNSGSHGGGGVGTLDRIKRDKKINVGFANEAPFGFRDDIGTLTGEAPELARAIFRAMGITQLQPVLATSFDLLIPGLVAHEYDIIAASMFITPERCQQIAFTDPDYFGSNAFVVEKGNPADIKTFAEVRTAKIRLGVLHGAVEKGYAKDAGVSGSKILTFPDQSTAFQGVLDGRVDAFALTSASLRWTLRQSYADSPLEVTEPFVPVVAGREQPNFSGFGVRKADTDLLNAFNAELKKLQQSNGVLPLIQRFGFTQLDVDKAKTQTADQLCKAI